mmetsp:Transcript_29632/g.99000  ORF Transcript_29632/g.99000 Transcript_29632/m.99000 type:complete len:216 (-) Transcript_29632:400-1047(-)
MLPSLTQSHAPAASRAAALNIRAPDSRSSCSKRRRPTYASALRWTSSASKRAHRYVRKSSGLRPPEPSPSTIPASFSSFWRRSASFSIAGSALRQFARQSLCVGSPRRQSFEFWPTRVASILSCSNELFCVSSAMMKASSNVRPRMNAKLCSSRTCRSRSSFHAPGPRIFETASSAGVANGCSLSTSLPGKWPSSSPAVTAARVRSSLLTLPARS